MTSKPGSALLLPIGQLRRAQHGHRLPGFRRAAAPICLSTATRFFGKPFMHQKQVVPMSHEQARQYTLHSVKATMLSIAKNTTGLSRNITANMVDKQRSAFAAETTCEERWHSSDLLFRGGETIRRPTFRNTTEQVRAATFGAPKSPTRLDKLYSRRTSAVTPPAKANIWRSMDVMETNLATASSSSCRLQLPPIDQSLSDEILTEQ